MLKIPHKKWPAQAGFFYRKSGESIDMVDPVLLLGILWRVVLAAGIPLMCAVWWWRRRFRIHLSTLLLLSVLIGGLMWLNLRPFKHGKLIGWPASVDPNNEGWKDDEENDRYERYWGWPRLSTKPAFWDLRIDPDDIFDFTYACFINFDCAITLITLAAILLERNVAPPEGRPML